MAHPIHLRHAETVRVQTAGDRHQPRHRAAPRHRRRCRTAASVSSSPCATAASTGAGTLVPPVTMSASSSSRRPTSASAAWTAEPVVVDQVGGGQRVQPRHRLQRRPLPDADQRRRAALQRLRHPQRTGQHRIGVPGPRTAATNHRRAPTTPLRPAAPPRRRSPAIPADWCGAGGPCPAPRGPPRPRRPRRAVRPAEPAGQPRRHGSTR